MKKLIYILVCLLLAVPASAVTLGWNSYTDDADGFVIYYKAKGETIDPYSEVINDKTVTQYTIDDNKFVANTLYEFWMTAYKENLESEPSNIVEWSRLPNQAPESNPGPVMLIVPNPVTTITIIQN